jgi:hypothetical protein
MGLQAKEKPHRHISWVKTSDTFKKKNFKTGDLYPA